MPSTSVDGKNICEPSFVGIIRKIQLAQFDNIRINIEMLDTVFKIPIFSKLIVKFPAKIGAHIFFLQQFSEASHRRAPLPGTFENRGKVPVLFP